jgi:hypothetical protein
MKPMIVALLLFYWLPAGCAYVSENAKMESYNRILDSYETAMRTSDFNAICQFVDPAAMVRQTCLKQFGELKIVDYRVNHVEVSPDRTQVLQEIEVDYYYLDNYVLKQVAYTQTWKYQPSSGKWLLQNGPPRFD